MDDLANLIFERSGKLLVARNRADLHIRKQFPYCGGILDIIEKRFFRDRARSVFAERPQPKIDAIKTAVARHARKRCDENLGRSAVEFRKGHIESRNCS